MATAREAHPSTDLRLARLHLRMGQLGLARAELEALAGSGELDDAGLLALAEARWRTGDIAGAGEAAQAYLATDGESVVGLVIAAEAVAAAGRPAEARRIAGRAIEQKDLPLDRIFAGMPRSSIWPADPADGARQAETLFDGDGAGALGATTSPSPAVVPPSETGAGDRVVAHDGPGFWDAEPVSSELPDGADELEAARRALALGHPDAALHFALTLRAAPELAPDVLAAIDAGPRSAELEVVRGDALGLAGRHDDARRAYAAAAALIGRDDAATPRPQEES